MKLLKFTTSTSYRESTSPLDDIHQKNKKPISIKEEINMVVDLLLLQKKEEDHFFDLRKEFTNALKKNCIYGTRLYK